MTLELNVYGGAALAIAYDLRRATLDVDAVIRSGTADFRKFALQVAREFDWPDDWANDAVKGFLSAEEDMQVILEAPGIRVQVPSADYLLAMKAMAMRIDAAEPKDREDIEALIKRAGYATAEQVLELVERHYPRHLVLPKTRFGIIEIMERLQQKKDQP